MTTFKSNTCKFFLYCAIFIYVLIYFNYMYVCVVNRKLENLYIRLIEVSITIYANLNVMVDRTSTSCAITHSEYVYITHIYIIQKALINLCFC